MVKRINDTRHPLLPQAVWKLMRALSLAWIVVVMVHTNGSVVRGNNWLGGNYLSDCVVFGRCACVVCASCEHLRWSTTHLFCSKNDQIL